MLQVQDRAQRIPFRAVNRRGVPGYDPGLQRHHILPRQLLSCRCFGSFFDRVGRSRVGFDDFRVNGMLLPSKEETALRVGLPLHRGPHRDYNEMVIERFGQIERDWSARSQEDPEAALSDTLMRMRLLQKALRKRLLQEQRRVKLNRNDPLGTGYDFAELDAMAETLYKAR